MRISDWSSDVCSSDLCKGSAIDIGAKNLLRRSIVICVIYGVSRPHHLRIEPGCLTDPGEVGRLTVLKHEIRNVERVSSGSKLDPVGYGPFDERSRAVQIFRASKNCRIRPETRRAGKECDRPCRSRW